MYVLYQDGSLIAQQSSIPLDSFRIYERDSCKWYIDTMGRKAYNRLYTDCRKLPEVKQFVQSLPKFDPDPDPIPNPDNINGSVKSNQI
jgi:hypothetical protein